MTALRQERGISLVVSMLASGFLSMIGLGLALLVSMGLRSDGNYADASWMLNAAEAGLELATHDLVALSDLSLALDGSQLGSLVDGPPNGVKTLPGGTALNLTAQTNLLNCARAAGCTSAQMNATTSDRPWGANNPQWRPYLYGPVSSVAASPAAMAHYVVVWVADDERETDGDPVHDAASGPDPGRGAVRLRAEVFGVSGARRSVEALVRRVCWTENKMERCQPGLRVQSWREVRQLLP